MRFRRWPRLTSYEDTPRKRAAFLRKQHRECESLPLFVAIEQAHQHDVETEMAADTRHVVVRRYDPRVRRAPSKRE